MSAKVHIFFSSHLLSESKRKKYYHIFKVNLAGTKSESKMNGFCLAPTFQFRCDHPTVQQVSGDTVIRWSLFQTNIQTLQADRENKLSLRNISIYINIISLAGTKLAPTFQLRCDHPTVQQVYGDN